MFDTPVFWYLDGCNMDEGFVFSPYKTRQEWKDEQKRFDDLNREFRNKENPEEDADLSIFDDEIID